MTTAVQRFVGAVAGSFQTLEEALQQIYYGLRVDTAVGAQLTQIGDFVGRPRAGVDDDDIYRRYVRAQIRVNRSDGISSDLLAVLSLIVYDDDAVYVREERGGATVVYRVEGIVLDDAIAVIAIDTLRTAASDGVRIILEWWQVPEEEMYEFADADAGGDGDEDDEDTGLSYDDDDDDFDAVIEGGALAAAID